ncbi:hypothetical protein [Streptomyces orinoci]|uniref:Uncharacterized protein n=1 Tax=Streptomyces orinoci TaxID=67339 RepID=A0ABV3JVD3_STRON|nr:hypothetical protein [Streptomyces orinoci]
MSKHPVMEEIVDPQTAQLRNASFTHRLIVVAAVRRAMGRPAGHQGH